MDLDYSADDLAFRDEVSDLAARASARGSARQGHALSSPQPRGSAALASHPRRQGLDRAGVADRMGRHRLERGAALHLRGGVRLRRRAAAGPVRPDDVRAGADQVRHRRAEAALPAADLSRRRVLVPGLLGARLRIGSRVAVDARRAPRRALHRQRAEDVDHARAVRRLDLLPGAHRRSRRRAQAGRHLVPAHRHEDAGHHRAPAGAHGRRPRGQRGVLRRRRGAGREPRRTTRARAGPSPSTCSATSA